MKIDVRLAQNPEGQQIAQLVKDSGFSIEGLSWDIVYPYWIVAEHEEIMVGAIQVCPSLPVGRLEMLSTANYMTHRVRAQTVKGLLLACLESLRQHGAQMVSGVIPFKMKAYKRMIRKRGGAVVASGNVIMWKL